MTEMTADSASRSRLRVILAASIGSALEWYDFFLYGTAAALVFGELFFPKSDPVVGTLLAFLTFGVGFVVRPLGGILFGIMGDRYGRKPVLVATLLMIGVGTTLIGLLPTYAQIGYWAPALLVAMRVIQGLGAGAEYGGAVIFLVENAPPKHRGFWGSFAPAASRLPTETPEQAGGGTCPTPLRMPHASLTSCCSSPSQTHETSQRRFSRGASSACLVRTLRPDHEKVSSRRGILGTRWTTLGCPS